MAPAPVPTRSGSALGHGLFLPPFGELAEPATVVELARLAEDRGWDGVFLWDHIQRGEGMPVADPWIVLSAVAASTREVRLGPMVTPLVRRRPHKLAREVATLDRLSGGRLVLGLGLGVDHSRELSAFGEVVDARERARMLDEGLEVLGGLLSGEMVVHHGEHYRADRALFLPTPVHGRVPVWMAARTTARRPLRRAAGQDGLFVIEQGPEAVADMLSLVAAERGGLDGFDVATTAGGDRDPGLFAEIGVTWWMTGPSPDEPLDAVFRLADQGPPA